MRISFLIGFMFAMQATAQDITIRSVKHPEIDFTRYMTYYWAEQVARETDEDGFFMNDLLLKADLRDAVRTELENLGYLPNHLTPDLIINFRVFEKPVTLSGYQGYGVKYWKPMEYSPAMKTDVTVEAGTIILSIVDRREGVLVWEGIATGLVDQNDFIREEGTLRKAVSLLLMDYGIRANEYTKR